MEVQELVRMEYSGQLVLTTKQIAEYYAVTENRITDNFKYAKKHFHEGEHYFRLTGGALYELKKQMGISHAAQSPIPKYASAIYLWTKAGCLRHCKMLNTPAAWAVFDMLEQFYFDNQQPPQEPTAPEPVPDELTKLQEELTRLREENTRLKRDNERLRKQIPKAQTLDLAVVYALLMGNGTVKIGYSGNLSGRIKSLKTEFNLEVLDYCCTPLMATEDARALEETLHRKFEAYRESGEFFSVCFVEVKAELKPM